jgi:hypothetical protein
VSILGVPKEQRQKNWCPFEWSDQGRPKLLCEYSINPHTIIDCTEFESQDHQCRIVADTNNSKIPYKHLSGGACPLLVGPNQYINVCHNYETTAFGKQYYNFLYTFQSDPPFGITSISKPFKIAQGEKIQFVSGLEYDPDSGELILSYGLDDSGIHVARFDLGRLMREAEVFSVT